MTRPFEERAAIVPTHEQSFGLKAADIRAMTFDGVSTVPDWAVRRYLADEPIALFVTAATEAQAKAVERRLRRLGLRTFLHWVGSR